MKSQAAIAYLLSARVGERALPARFRRIANNSVAVPR